MSAWFEAVVEAPVMKHLIEDEVIFAVKTREVGLRMKVK
jgi:hypothetical protein